MQRSTSTRYDVQEYGAAGDGSTLDTEPIQTALDECAETGGTVVVPPGEYLTAPLVIGDDTTLHIESGARIQLVGDYSEFPTAKGRWEGWDQFGFHPCVLVSDAENVAITGHGKIDGGGEYWWDFYEVPESELPDGLQDRLAEFDELNEKEDDVSSFTQRPPLLQIDDSRNVSVSGITLRNSPFWNTHVVYSNDVTIHDVTIYNPADAPNGDGLDIDSSQYVKVSDAAIDVGDDAICLKSGKNAGGRERGEPASNITVTNCTVKAGHGGVVVGSEMSGDVRDVTVSNCTFAGTDRGIRIKTKRGRGGVVEDIRFASIVMRDVACPFVVNGYYFTDIDSEPEPVDETTPLVRHVHFSDITARNVESAGFLAGLPEQHFEDITFDNVDIDATRPLTATELDPAMAENYDQQHGLFCKSIADISFDNVRIRTAETPTFQIEATETVSIDGLTVDDEASPTIAANNVETMRISGVSAHSETFLQVAGELETAISLAGNHGALEDAIDIEDGTNATIDG